jgi:HlyD family type I secretion membrane fusion protein
MSIHTVGGVVAPGQKLMDLIPQGGELEVEVMIPPHLIDNVLVGQEADVQFTALDMTIIPSIRGKLIYVSADRQTDPRTDQPFFIGRVQMTPEGMQKLQHHTLVPGMPAEVVIKNGERTLLAYLLKPVLARMRFAFTER